ncbi:MAG: hypothetical protein H6566_30205 [Lewinellaceae bacterium]|nr:hypothetical protein [Lewinellaceae bacterium]
MLNIIQPPPKKAALRETKKTTDMITIKVRTVDAGVYCLQLHYLIEHFVAGKKEEEIDWCLVNTLNNLFRKFDAISDIVDDVLPVELTSEEARILYFTLTQKKYAVTLESIPEAMEGGLYEAFNLIKDKMIFQLEAKLKPVA